MNADGSGEARLTTGPSQDRYSDWSPDGRRVAFASNRDGGALQIYVMNAGGANPTRVTRMKGALASPT